MTSKLKIGKKSGLKYFDLEFIRSLKPCRDPSTKAPENWRGTALDVLNASNLEPNDKFWVVLRSEVLAEKTLRLFAVWCARQVQHLMTDERSIKALDVAEAYAHGTATKEELDIAYVSAAAATSAAAYVSYYALSSSVNCAIETAHASASAYATASGCGSTAAASSDFVSSYASAAYVSYYAPYQRIERIKQVEQLKQMIIQEGKERLNAKS